MRKAMVFLVLLGLALPSRVAAWHNEGHMAVARIAWQQLDDGQRKQALLLLERLPFKEDFFASPPADVPEPMWKFAKAATWPDWVKSPTGPSLQPEDVAKIKQKYDKRNQHFVNLPFVHPEETDKFDAVALRKQVLEPELNAQGEPRHALAAIKRSLKLLQAADTSAEDKAIHLCWVLHLIGDIHQPLHAVALIGSQAKFSSERFGPQPFDAPGGDQGGNRCAIKVNKTDKNALELHTFWDGLQFSDRPKFPELEARVLEWLQDPKLKRDQFPELEKVELLAWAEESLELAKSKAYKEGDSLLEFTPLPLKHKPEDLLNLDAHPLSDAYKQTAAEVAKKRIVLAGYRLADQLKPVLKPAP
jgi:hypothetical protein